MSTPHVPSNTSLLIKLVIIFIIGTLIGQLGVILIEKKFLAPDDKELIAQYYDTENLVSVSPHGLRGKMDVGDTSFVLVDLRSAEEYEKEHITGAINIPAYSDKDHSAYDDVDRIVESFKNLPDNTDVITYCYSSACMTSRKIGKMLADHKIYVKHLNIGWNEWRYDWNSWNHEHEWDGTKPEDYISTGKEPGKLEMHGIPGQCTEGNFGC